ncbi:MAG: Nif3-like dinuclear metal center hexameric protein [Clostridia bacterium]|nr:Nif3-like dinuclear metal center hexameric protein [Clostridia bacterium]
MTVWEFYNNLCELYPSTLSCDWDNDGLMCCADPEKEVKKVLVSLDASKEALCYAAENGFDTLLVHHPLIFRGLNRVTPCDAVGERVIIALQNGISVISLHTRLDCGTGGVNDTLAEILELANVRAFGDSDYPQFGRMGETDERDPEAFAEKIKAATGAEKVTAYVCRPVKTVAVVGGSAGEFFEAAKKAGADTLVTGECKYHEGLDAKDTGMNIFAAGHYFTEMPVTETLRALAENIAGAVTDVYKPVPEKTY